MRDQTKEDAAAIHYEQSLLFGKVRRASQKKKRTKEQNKTGKKRKREIVVSALQGALGVRRPIINFSHQLFFFLFFFLHKRRTSLKRKTGTACSLQLPKRLQTHTKFAYCNLSRKLRCYAGISSPEKSRNNRDEKISYLFTLFTCVDIANTICRNFIYKRRNRCTLV